MRRQYAALAVAVILAVAPGLAGQETAMEETVATVPNGEDTARSGEEVLLDPATELVRSQTDPKLRLLLQEILHRNPSVAALTAQAAAADQRAPQVKALPDPVVSVTAFLSSPQTRVGPQYGTVALSQRFPWFGKLPAREQVELAAAVAARTRVASRRLEVVTEARRLAYELAWLDHEDREVRTDRETLEHYEELARARYVSGVGIQQSIIKIGAEISRDDNRLLEIARRRGTLEARLNVLRDRPRGTPLPSFELPKEVTPASDAAALFQEALLRRPELAEVEALIQRAENAGVVAQKEYSPDVTAGIAWTWVGERSDPAGEANPPENNGKDVLALFASVNLPVHRERLAAGVEEAGQQRLAAEARRRAIRAEIEGDIADLTNRMKTTAAQVRLFEDVLVAQARQSLDSAESAYATGNIAVLDLLDAERTLLEVRLAAARARTDWAIAMAGLEGAVGRPLSPMNQQENTK